MTVDPTPAARRTGPAGRRSHNVRQMLKSCRAGLYGRRGLRISGPDWVRNTSLRSGVAGVPTAASREDLHPRTLRARGRHGDATAEAAWAAAQSALPGAIGASGDSRVRWGAPALVRPIGRPRKETWPSAQVLGWLAAAWLWIRHRSSPRRPQQGRSG